jgi:hypothetical protein
MPTQPASAVGVAASVGDTTASRMNLTLHLPLAECSPRAAERSLSGRWQRPALKGRGSHWSDPSYAKSCDGGYPATQVGPRKQFRA